MILLLDFKIFFIADDQAFSFSVGRPIVKALVLISHPRKMMCSAIPPSASSFRRDAVSGHSIGSRFPALGLNWRCNAIKTPASARLTCCVFSSDASTAVARSSM